MHCILTSSRFGEGVVTALDGRGQVLVGDEVDDGDVEKSTLRTVLVAGCHCRLDYQIYPQPST